MRTWPPRIALALKTANWAMALAIAAAGGALLFPSLACKSLEPEVSLDDRDSLAVLAILQANQKTWPKGSSFLARDPDGHVIRLQLSGMELDTITPDIGELIHLQRADFSRNHLRGLPREFEALTDLEYLDLSLNLFDSLPDGFTLARLAELYLSNNRLSAFPRNVDATGLRTLEADNNLIGSLPPDFRYLHNLVSFSLRANRLDSLPESFDPSNHPSLKRLALADNRLSALPRFMAGFSLEYLDLGRNRLCLPDTAQADSAQRALIGWLDSSDRDWRASQTCP